jgi:hypothetical protein
LRFRKCGWGKDIKLAFWIFNPENGLENPFHAYPPYTKSGQGAKREY